ncbi:MAG TPA: T9SS type A sorting domain-containing protein [Pelobium sp.]|nr:T9SS type A sorting domain-containing protein [Pelobium sp.]
MWSNTSWVYVDFSQNRSYSYFPNPVKNELTVTYETLENQAVNDEAPVNKVQIPVFEIKLLDNKGLVLKSAKSEGSKNSINISTEDIPDGTYFLHILNNGKSIKKQIIVQH